jgi:hypothetical protein
LWQEEDGSIVLEAANPTKPWLPVRLREGEHRFRRVVGVLFADLDVTIGSEGKEWVLCSANPSEVEDPMRVDPETIRYAYPVCGVMFES